MSIFKCKMCGGALEIKDGESVAVCEYCGTKQTLPKTKDEVVANLFNRANNLRLKGEFDKAAQAYERIVEADDSEAEAHWGIVLCKYGIEYVEDPKTGKRIPTCHRTLFNAVTSDPDYIAAIDYSDPAQQIVYENEAREIDRIQKDILAIVKNEKPFDVFICYKESDADKRTVDSVIANDIYYQLTQAGFRVFYAAITLEDKLGKEYEPYIFAALNSAKVMLVLGTKPEYFNAVWVKNEWSRFMQLMKTDRSRLLIPCYRDMNAYDLPEEFSHLQAQDMSKIGFINDVIRGIKKVFETDEKTARVKESVVVPSTENANIAPLLKRAFMFLEDGNWQDADTYCEKVLDLDPECGEAYLGKLMAELNVRTRQQLADCKKPFDDRENFAKVIRFGDDKIIAEMQGYVAHINERNENERLQNLYDKAVTYMINAFSKDEYKAVTSMFQNISGFKDSDILAEQCLEKAENCRKDEIYKDACRCMSKNNIADVQVGIRYFEQIRGWKESDKNIVECKRRIEELKEKQEADRKEAERKAEEARIARAKSLKKAKRVAAIVIPSVCAVVVFLIILFNVIIPNVKYNNAVALMNEGKYKEAISVFSKLNGYKDSRTKFNDCMYSNALSLMNEGEYKEAITVFRKLNGYKDSRTKINDCQYAYAISLIEKKKYIEAYKEFISLDGYKDSYTMASKAFNCYKTEKLKTAEVGDIVLFGAYEQDNNLSNGKEDIEWLVLAKKDDKILVISDNALDCQPYNTTDTDDVMWESCSLRKWLNGTFLNAAFSTEEQALILNTNVSADKNLEYDTNPGNATTDKVFLLSIDEADKYFNSDEARKCVPTVYSKANGAYTSSGYCWWWLRSPGFSQDFAVNVYVGGSILYNGIDVNFGSGCVRPAMWIDIGD